MNHISLAALLIRLFGLGMMLFPAADLTRCVVRSPWALLNPFNYIDLTGGLIVGLFLRAVSKPLASLICRGLDGAGLK